MKKIKINALGLSLSFFAASAAQATGIACSEKAHNYARAVVGIENSLNYPVSDTVTLGAENIYTVSVAANGNYPNFFTYEVTVANTSDDCTVLNIKYVDVDGEGPNGN